MEVGKGYSRMQNYTCDMELALYTNCLCNWALTLLLLSTAFCIRKDASNDSQPQICLNSKKILLSYISRNPETR